MSDLLRVYLNPDEIGSDGYPFAWHGKMPGPRFPNGSRYEPFQPSGEGPIKDLVRKQTGHRCERCGHPYAKSNPLNSARSEWTPCDDCCEHGDPLLEEEDEDGVCRLFAQWRILTVHHLNGIKHDCRWWNLAALCQRCHLAIQGRVVMERVWPWEHSEWFKPHAAGWYAAAYLGEDLSREETMARLDELLDLERQT